MTRFEKRVYRVIGKVFHDFVRGKPNIDILRTEIQWLNQLLLHEYIESNEYDYLVDILEDCIKFMTS